MTQSYVYSPIRSKPSRFDYTKEFEQVWDTEPDGRGLTGCYLILQTDGNLVMYNSSNSPLWYSGTHPYFDSKWESSTLKPVKLVLDNRGLMVLYNASNQPVWSNQSPLTIGVEKRIFTEKLFSANNSYNLGIENGNVVIRGGKDNSITWKTSTLGGDGCYLKMENTGEVVLRDKNNTRLWGSLTTSTQNSFYGTSEGKSVKFALTNNGKLVLYNQNEKPVKEVN